MFFNTRDPRTQLQGRLNSESKSQHDDCGCREDHSCTPTSTITETDTSSNAHRLFRSGSPETTSKKLVSVTGR